MYKFPALIVALLMSGTLYAAESARFITTVTLPSGQTAVIAEGDYEARSIGSFSVRVYDAALPADETTFFSTGLVHARDGAIKKVVLADVIGGPQPEIIVITRGVGTGGFLSAHAFAIDQQSLRLEASVKGLPPDSDPIAVMHTSKIKR